MHRLKTLLDKIQKAVKKWWEGTYAPEPPGSPFLSGCYEKHWTAELAHKLVNFHNREWKFIWGAIIALVTGYLLK